MKVTIYCNNRPCQYMAEFDGDVHSLLQGFIAEDGTVFFTEVTPQFHPMTGEPLTWALRDQAIREGWLDAKF